MQQRELIKQKHGGALKPPLKKGESGNPNGRPKNHVQKIVEELQLQFDDTVNKLTVRALLGSLIYLPKEQLDKLGDDESMPMSIRLYIRSIKKDWQNRSTDTVKNIIEFEFGRATQKIEVDDKREPVSNLVDKDKILNTMRRFCEILTLEDLEEFGKIYKEVLLLKKANGAKVIEQK